VELTITSCAYAGTGNVVQVQKMLRILTAPTTATAAAAAAEGDEKNTASQDAIFQSVAVLGIGLLAMGEDLGSDMCRRAFDHILQCGSLHARRAVPLALAVLNISDPRIDVVDTLGKLTHDHDHDTSQNAIAALGLVAAGSNNARVAGMLRNLAVYYQREPLHLFLVRVAQGLLYLGKGLLTLSPFHSDRVLLDNVALCGLLTFVHSCFDAKTLFLAKYHHLIFTLVTAINPRMLVTLDADSLEPVQVPMRVGTAVDTVAQAGRPRGITGFQTHNTPVLIHHDQRAELATQQYKALSSVMEGIVLLQKTEVPTEES